MKTLILVLVILLIAAGSYAQNEQSPITAKELVYKNWTYKNVRTGEQIDLRDFTKGKKLVMVVYFAPWCPNWKNDAPFVQALYEKYKGKGFDVVGVGEYDTTDAMRKHMDAFKITFPVVYESEARDAKKTTLHYGYRTAAGDTRNWGSPWTIFLVPKELEKKGDVLVTRAQVVNGELIQVEAEKFIREKLRLPAEGKAATAQKWQVLTTVPPQKTKQ